MPIADCDGYEKGHFAHVYDDIIKPAIDKTEFTAIRADEVKETNFYPFRYTEKAYRCSDSCL